MKSAFSETLKQEQAPAGSPTELTGSETDNVAGGAPGDHGNAYGYGAGAGLGFAGHGGGEGVGWSSNNENGRF